jgi:hypothetical protein
MTTPTADELLALCEKASPGPWHACQDGKCSCKQVWTAEYPVAKVESGEWGDFYPALRVKENEHGLHGTSVAIEAFMDGLPYGEIYEETARANVQLIAASREAIPRLIADNAGLRKRLEAAESVRQHSRLLFVAKRVLIGALDRGDLRIAVDEHEALLAAALAPNDSRAAGPSQMSPAGPE